MPKGHIKPDAGSVRDREVHAESALLAPTKKKHTPEKLHEIIRQMVCCRSRLDRLIVYRHEYLGQDMRAVAKSLGEPERRLWELLNSVCLRVTEAERTYKAEQILAQNWRSMKRKLGLRSR